MIANTRTGLPRILAACLCSCFALLPAQGAERGAFAPPSITSISPESPVATNDRQTVIVRGSNFDHRAAVHLKDLRTDEVFRDRRVYERSSTHLELRLNFTNQPAEWSVDVVNPDGRGSGEHRFRVIAPPAPKITGIDPADPVGADARQSVVIHGEHFQPKVKVTFRDLTRSETFTNRIVYSSAGDQLLLRVNFTAQPAVWSVEVANPDGQTSGEYRFRVVAPPPTGSTAAHATEGELISRAVQWADSQRGRNVQPCATPGCIYNPDNTGPTRCDNPAAPFNHQPWYFWCARFVSNCYGAERAGFESAQDIYNALHAASAIQSVRAEIPVGALVFWYWRAAPMAPDEPGKEYGHVGIYIGSGRVMHTGVGRANGVRSDRIDSITSTLDKSPMLDGDSSFLGWAAPFSWRGVLDWPGR